MKYNPQCHAIPAAYKFQASTAYTLDSLFGKNLPSSIQKYPGLFGVSTVVMFSCNFVILWHEYKAS